jgi:hypothetical protein
LVDRLTVSILQPHHPADIEQTIQQLKRLGGILRKVSGPIFLEPQPQEIIFHLPDMCKMGMGAYLISGKSVVICGVLFAQSSYLVHDNVSRWYEPFPNITSTFPLIDVVPTAS